MSIFLDLWNKLTLTEVLLLGFILHIALAFLLAVFLGIAYATAVLALMNAGDDGGDDDDPPPGKELPLETAGGDVIKVDFRNRGESVLKKGA